MHDRWRNTAAMLGIAFALAIWVTAEGLGSLTTGQATDPNSGPLLVLLSAALRASRHPVAPSHEAERSNYEPVAALALLSQVRNRPHRRVVPSLAPTTITSTDRAVPAIPRRKKLGCEENTSRPCWWPRSSCWY
jgi:hypothetical protein